MQAPAGPQSTAESAIPALGQAKRHRTRSRSGRISADSIVDHNHQEKRETTKSLLIIVGFILAIFACLTVTWIMSDLMLK